MRDAAWGSAAGVTRHASTQSYLTIRTLADRAYRHDAFALYAYFRWLDDQVDEALGTVAERIAVVERQRRLMAGAGPAPATVAPPERLLVGLLRRSDGEPRADAAGAWLAVRRAARSSWYWAGVRKAMSVHPCPISSIVRLPQPTHAVGSGL